MARSTLKAFVLSAIASIALASAAIYRTASAFRRSTQASVPRDPHDDYVPLAFKTLASFKYEVPVRDETGNGQIPPSIKSFNGWRVAVEGFINPVNLANGKSTHFLLTLNETGCWGPMPRANEFIDVHMAAGKAARVTMGRPIRVWGVLRVGDMTDKGEFVSLYRLEADEVVGP